MNSNPLQKVRPHTLILLLLLSFSSCLFGQCEALVRYGVFDTTATSSDSASVSTFMNWVRDHRSSIVGNSDSGGISIPVIGDLNGSSSQYSQMEYEYAALNRGDAAETQHLTTLVRSVDRALAQEFVECMTARGLHVWIENRDDPHVFKLAAVYNSAGRGDDSATIRSVNKVPPTLSCDDNIAARKVIDGSTTRMLCTRKNDEAVVIALNASREPVGGGSLKLASIPKSQPPPPPTCDTWVLVSRNATASSSRLTDGVVGAAVPGVNSMHPDGSFYVELFRPEWVHHVILYPLQSGNGSDQTNTIVGTTSDGKQVTLTTLRSVVTTTPLELMVDQTQSRNIKRITVNTKTMNGRDWVAWSEFEVFAYR